MNKFFFAQLLLCTQFLYIFSAEKQRERLCAPETLALLSELTRLKCSDLEPREKALPLINEKDGSYNLLCKNHFDALKVQTQDHSIPASVLFLTKNRFSLHPGKNTLFSIEGPTIETKPLIKQRGYSKSIVTKGTITIVSWDIEYTPGSEGNEPIVEFKSGQKYTVNVT